MDAESLLDELIAAVIDGSYERTERFLQAGALLDIAEVD